MGKRKIIGITGNLGAGKTTVSDMLVEKGAVKIDVDGIGHQVLAEDENVKQALIDLFGEKILSDGKIDRKKLGREVFSDEKKVEKLNRLLHPLMIGRIKEEVSRFTEDVLLIDASLLIEMELDKITDMIVVVTADEETGIKRAANRGISGKEARDIIARQMGLSEKLIAADYVIDNNGDLNTTKKGVDELWKRIQDL